MLSPSASFAILEMSFDQSSPIERVPKSKLGPTICSVLGFTLISFNGGGAADAFRPTSPLKTCTTDSPLPVIEPSSIIVVQSLDLKNSIHSS